MLEQDTIDIWCKNFFIIKRIYPYGKNDDDFYVYYEMKDDYEPSPEYLQELFQDIFETRNYIHYFDKTYCEYKQFFNDENSTTVYNREKFKLKQKKENIILKNLQIKAKKYKIRLTKVECGKRIYKNKIRLEHDIKEKLKMK